MPKKTRISGASAPNVYTKQYRKFSGVDFSQSEAMVDDMHSPRAQNLISDTGGFPEKRVGWRVLQTLSGRINGIYRYDGENAEGEKVSCFIIHAGTTIYRYDGGESEPVALLSGVFDGKSFGQYFREKLYILTGAEVVEFDGEVARNGRDSTKIYVPRTTVSKGIWTISDEGGTIWDDDNFTYGTAMEGINLMSPRRINTFCVRSSPNYERNFSLDGPADAGSRLVVKYIPTGAVLLDVTLGDSNDNSFDAPSAVWRSTVANNKIRIRRVHTDGNCHITSYFKPEKISRFTAPEGIDNISIEFSSTSEDYQSRIGKCTFCGIYDNRMFYSGNPDYPNTDWVSGVNDPTYVPDLSYTDIGSDSSAIMGYLRIGGEQAILKEDGEGATVYMRSSMTDSEGKVIFPIREGMSGIGAIAPHAVCTFLDDPVYLTRNGVYAIAMQDISSERALNIRSTRINKRLLKNANLSDAVMVQWRGYLLLCVGDECYVADAAQKTYSGNKTGTFEYEWYYWTNIPARVFCEHDGELYFGTEDGRLCKFNSDLVNDRGELKSEAYSDDGEAIVAEWATNLSDDGDFMLKKTMVKKGSGVFLKTYNRSGVKVYVRTDAGFEEMIVSKSAGVFDFEDIDFADFTFNTSPYSVVPFNTRIKKYSAIQIICRNDKPNHAFGVHSIVRRFFIGNTKK